MEDNNIALTQRKGAIKQTRLKELLKNIGGNIKNGLYLKD